MAVYWVIAQSIMLASSCSLDTFAASFAYGSKGIRIPWGSNLIISLVCCGVLGLSLWLGTLVRSSIPGWLTAGAAFGILFLIGLTKLLDSATKAVIRRLTRKNGERLHKHVRFSLFNIKFILTLYADPEEADINENQIISPGEAAALAASLSLDGLAAGFGAALGQVSIPAVIITSLVTGTLAVFLGCRLGNRFSRRLPISWLSGVILIGLAVSKLC